MSGQTLFVVVILCVVVSMVKGLDQCYNMDIEQCTGLGYNMTSITEKEQWNVIEKISVFTALVDSKCSTVLQPFLCFALAPKCRADIAYEIKPCAETCRRVKEECEGQLTELLVGWDTKHFDCEKQEEFRPKGLFRCVSYTKVNNLLREKATPAPATAAPATTEAEGNSINN